MLGLIEGGPVRLRRRRERGEEPGGDQHAREERGLADDAAPELRGRCAAASHPRSPHQQIERSEPEQQGEQHDLREQRDAVRGLDEIFEEHQAIKRLQRPGRDDDRRGGEGSERKPPDRAPELLRILRSR